MPRITTRHVLSTLGVAITFLLLAAVLFPFFVQAKGGSVKSPTCLRNMVEIGRAFQAYVADHDDRYPLASNWIDSSIPFLTVSRIPPTNKEAQTYFQCPLVPKGGYGYAMNAFLSGAHVSALDNPKEMHLVYESKDTAKNASEYLPLVPIPGRHPHATNIFLFADGSTRALLTEAK
ncbi:MAG: hypothetical protein ACAH95_17145 [Fimbriimonas sp.]